MYGGGFSYYFNFYIASAKAVMFARNSHTSKMRKIGDLHLTRFMIHMFNGIEKIMYYHVVWGSIVSTQTYLTKRIRP